MPCCNIVQNSVGLEIGTPKFENLILTKCTPGKSLTSLKPGSIHNQDFSKFSTGNVAPRLHSNKHIDAVNAANAFSALSTSFCLPLMSGIPNGHRSDRQRGSHARISVSCGKRKMNMFEAACRHCFKQARAILESIKLENIMGNHGLAHGRLLASTAIVRTPVPKHSRKQAGGKVTDNGGNPAKHGGITAILPSGSQLLGRLSLRFCCSSLRWLILLNQFWVFMARLDNGFP